MSMIIIGTKNAPDTCDEQAFFKNMYDSLYQIIQEISHGFFDTILRSRSNGGRTKGLQWLLLPWYNHKINTNIETLNLANVADGTPLLWFMIAFATGSDLFWLPGKYTSCVRDLKTQTRKLSVRSWVFLKRYFIFWILDRRCVTLGHKWLSNKRWWHTYYCWGYNTQNLT